MADPAVVVTRAALALLLFGASCSSSAGTSTRGARAEGGSSVPARGADAQQGSPGSEADRENVVDSVASPLGPSTDQGAGPEEGTSQSGPDGGKLPPPQLPVRPTVPVRASVSPACVARGEKIVLEVATKPKSAIGYQAVYSDGRGGSGPPFGAGYGGNDKGFASESGSYSSSWVVSPEAPVGRGRVDVVIGFRGDLGYDDPHFAVADDDGNCPESWLREGE